METASGKLSPQEEFRRQWDDPTPVIEAHTSGSTGTPKRILLPKADMRVSALATCRRFGINGNSLLHQCLSTEYIAGKMMLVRSYLSGAHIFSESPSNHPLSSDPGCDIALTAIVPSQTEGLLASPFRERIRNIIVGGAPLAPGQEKMLQQSGIPAYATYGMTETCSHVALRRIGEEIYEAMPGINFSTDGRGCLRIHAPEYSFGELTTNDIVSLESAHSFRWKGRYDNVINSGGIKIFPEECEASLREIFPDLEFYITSRPSGRWGEEAVMAVTRSSAAACGLPEEEILDRTRGKLGARKAPKAIAWRDSFAHTANGKLLRERPICAYGIQK